MKQCIIILSPKTFQETIIELYGSNIGVKYTNYLLHELLKHTNQNNPLLLILLMVFSRLTKQIIGNLIQ